ncbi:MAG: spore germination protein GerW family protein, partial [Oscillospiraceae bacterium]
MKEQTSAAGILGTTIEKVRSLVDVSTIIGEPVYTEEGLTIIPVSKVTYGFASGGADFPSKSNQELFGGGGGAGSGTNGGPDGRQRPTPGSRCGCGRRPAGAGAGGPDG